MSSQAEVHQLTKQMVTEFLIFFKINKNKKPYGFIDGPFIPQDTQSKKSEYIESA